ncbi:MAG: sulfotransferase family protein [Candidatus Promineifilaceae bacterium]
MSGGPIFVVGAPRSGTTLIGRIIGRHPDVFHAGESHFFEDVWSRREQLGPIDTPAGFGRAYERLANLFGRYDFAERQRQVERCLSPERLAAGLQGTAAGYGGLYRAFLGLLAGETGKSRTCDDTPKHLYFLHAIFELLPDAQVIGCLRDPRDFMCSYKHYWRAANPAEAARLRRLYHPLLTAYNWRASAELLEYHAKNCCQDRLRLVQYEALVCDPRQQAKQLCGFLGLPFSAEFLNVTGHNSSFAAAQSGIFTASVGRWRDCLEPAEVWLGQRVGRRAMARLGYPLAEARAQPLAVLAIALLTPVALLRALAANRGRRGPLMPYLWKRLNGSLGVRR